LINILAALLLFSLTTPAYAYIDPGSGSAIMSAIIGAIVAFGILLKTYWYKLKYLIMGKGSSDSEENPSDSE